MIECQTESKQDDVCIMTYSYFNMVKFQILLAIDHLNTHGEIADTTNISRISGLSVESVRRAMYRQLRPCVKKYVNNAPGGHFKYKLSESGKRRLDKMLWRYEEGYTLRLRGLPKKADYSGIELLPGLKKETDDDNTP